MDENPRLADTPRCRQRLNWLFHYIGPAGKRWVHKPTSLSVDEIRQLTDQIAALPSRLPGDT